MKTPLRYAGGKSKAIKTITPFVKDYEKIISPFIGGGSLEVHWSNTLKKRVIGYDVFDILVNFWNILLEKPEELYEELSEINPTKDEYNRIKELLLRDIRTQNLLLKWKTDYYKRENVIRLSPLKLAAYCYFNHNSSYGPGYLGWGSSVYLQKDKWEGMINKIKNFKCNTLQIENLSFEDSIEKHKTDFLYLDPPYFLNKDKDNKMHKGMYPMKNIDVHHSSFNHELLRDLLLSHEGDFVLSYNNCETIREYYKDFEFYYPQWNYSMGNGEKRIGKNRRQNNNEIVKKSHEILIVKRRS